MRICDQKWSNDFILVNDLIFKKLHKSQISKLIKAFVCDIAENSLRDENLFDWFEA
jgi:hypothetical protein